MRAGDLRKSAPFSAVRSRYTTKFSAFAAQSSAKRPALLEKAKQTSALANAIISKVPSTIRRPANTASDPEKPIRNSVRAICQHRVVRKPAAPKLRARSNAPLRFVEVSASPEVVGFRGGGAHL